MKCTFWLTEPEDEEIPGRCAALAKKVKGRKWEMLFCPNCGSKNEDGARFCENCGTQLEEIQSVTQQKPWEEDVTAEVEMQTAESDQSDISQQQGDDEPAIPLQMKKARQQSDSSMTHKHSSIDVNQHKGKSIKLTKMQGVVIVEAFCLVLIIAAFFATGSVRNRPESVAKNFFQAFVDQNWSKVYDMTDYPEGVFFQKDWFVEMRKNNQAPEIVSFEIVEDKDASSAIQRHFIVQYTVKGQGMDSLELDLIKQREKNMLFFDTWKVSSASQVAKDFCINVPKGASVTVAGVALTDAEKGESQIEGMDSYYITLLTVAYKIQVALPWFEVYEDYFTAVPGEQFSVTGMKLTEDGQTAIEAKMQQALEKVYRAAMAGKDFSEVPKLFLDEYQDVCKESYDYLVSELHHSESYTLNQAVFNNFECTVYNEDNNQGLISAEMTFDYDSQYTYSYKSWRDDSIKSEEKNDSGSSYMNASFGYDGETYKIAAFSIRSII